MPGVLDCFTSFAMTGSGDWIASLRSQWQGAGCWIASLRLQWRGAGLLDCFALLAMTGVRSVDCHASLAMTGAGSGWIASLCSQWREEGDWIATLRSQWRGAGCWIAVLCSQWREERDWIASLCSQWRERRVLDCRASLAMTGSGDWIATLRSQWQVWGRWIATLRSQWREERGVEKVKHWKSLKKIALSLFWNILSWVFSWVMNLKMKKSKWLPAGFWDDFDKTFSRLFTGANLVALGFSGLYYAIYWILGRMYSSLFTGLLGIYSIIGNGSLEGELLQRWLPAGDVFFPNMWYLSVIGLAVVSLSFVIAQLVNKRKGNLTRFSFWLMLFFFVLLALPYVGMFCNGVDVVFGR